MNAKDAQSLRKYTEGDWNYDEEPAKPTAPWWWPIAVWFNTWLSMFR
jgi:hypothetical protein